MNVWHSFSVKVSVNIAYPAVADSCVHDCGIVSEGA